MALVSCREKVSMSGMPYSSGGAASATLVPMSTPLMRFTTRRHPAGDNTNTNAHAHIVIAVDQDLHTDLLTTGLLIFWQSSRARPDGLNCAVIRVDNFCSCPLLPRRVVATSFLMCVGGRISDDRLFCGSF